MITENKTITYGLSNVGVYKGAIAEKRFALKHNIKYIDLNRRNRIARALVRWVSSAMDESYGAYVEFDGQNVKKEQLWNNRSKRRQKIAFPLANMIDKQAAGDQMAMEGWWG